MISGVHLSQDKKFVSRQDKDSSAVIIPPQYLNVRTFLESRDRHHRELPAPFFLHSES